MELIAGYNKTLVQKKRMDKNICLKHRYIFTSNIDKVFVAISLIH